VQMRRAPLLSPFAQRSPPSGTRLQPRSPKTKVHSLSFVVVGIFKASADDQYRTSGLISVTLGHSAALQLSKSIGRLKLHF
jgi:hypothetical protein